MRIKVINSRILLLLAFVFIYNTSFAQKNNPLINSGEKITQGYQKFLDGNFKEAIKLYHEVNKSDTNYSNALFETVNALQSDSQHVEAIELAKKGIKLFPHMYSQFAMQIGNSLDNLKRDEEAIVYYDSAMLKNPNDYLIPFNKGIAYYRMEKMDKAKENFEKTLIINPLHARSHYLIGAIYLKDGNLVPAIMAFSTYLILAPSGDLNSITIKLLNDISKGTDDVLEFAKNRKKEDGKSYTEIQELLLSKIAFNSKYKSIVNIDDNLIKQLQVVNEKLEYNTKDKEFAMQFYVPFYSQIFKDKLFEPLIYTMFSSVELKQIESWRKNNKKALDQFANAGATYLTSIRSTRTLDYEKRESVENRYIYDNSVLLAKGIYKEEKKKFLPAGYWEFYYNTGIIQTKGTFGDEAQKTGVWTNYYKTGKIKENITYKENRQNGKADGWFENSNKWYTETNKEGLTEGLQTIYFYNEKIKAVENYKAGLKEGIQKYYNYKGELTSTETLKGGKLNGPTAVFYKNGKHKEESNYENDIENSDYKYYYKSGKIQTTGKVVNGNRDGLWTGFFEDGKVKYKTTYSKGDITGEFSELYNNGVVSMNGNYSKKKLDGKITYRDEDGKVYCESIYEKGKLREINFFDKKGGVVSSTSTRKGAANITFYDASSRKTSEGFYDKAGSRQGKHFSYYSSGKVSQELNYKDDELDGPSIKYYTNGKISEETNYKAGNEDGYYKAYFLNGKIKREGWMVDGNMEQNWIYNNVNGDVVKKVYYLNNAASGYTEYFYPGNVPDYNIRYVNAWVEEVIQFDTLGKVIQTNTFEGGNGSYTFKHLNGKILSEVPQKNYMNNGVKKSYFFTGQVSATSTLENDDLVGESTSYYLNGKVKSVGNYVDNNKEGIWKYYYDNGQIKREELFVDGEINGFVKRYKKNGDLEVSLTYKEGELDGPYTFYGDKNEIAIVYNYEKDQIKGYQYETAPGKLSDTIKLVNLSGKAEGKYANGKPSTDLTFVDNNINGKYRYYYSNGNLMSEGNMNQGYYDGVQKTYHPNGKLAKQSNYILGNLYGEYTTYNEDGSIASEENYYDDDNHGVQKYYDSNKKLKTITYYYGYIISEK